MIFKTIKQCEKALGKTVEKLSQDHGMSASQYMQEIVDAYDGGSMKDGESVRAWARDKWDLRYAEAAALEEIFWIEKQYWKFRERMVA